MKVLFISGPLCSRCHTLKPYLEKYCEEKWYELIEKDVASATPEEIWEATMLPVVWMWDEQMDYDKVLETITK